MRPTTLLALSAIALTAACASPSAQHSAGAVTHSAQASAHGSAAVVTGTAQVAAVPLTAMGTVLTVSGSALQGVADQPLCDDITLPCVAPDGPPVLN